MIQTVRSGRRSWPFGTSKECDKEMEQRTGTNRAAAIAILQMRSWCRSWILEYTLRADSLKVCSTKCLRQ